ncbi:hypothetical protein ABZ322_38350 [Streptomyces sp. NPDC006129]|uniref:hypothetical protein n=1 Tax=Streptomyces sp. NPDC006129 TaxID=3155348 RepID=UPI0033A83E22
MKLGKALAIGVAEEQPQDQVRDEGIELPALADLPDLRDVEETASEEVPVAR